MAGLVAERTLAVEGLQDMTRAFRAADKMLQRDLRRTLADAIRPVADDAESLAMQEITNIGIPWSRMRVGVTQTVAYVAPVERGVKSRGLATLRRRNLKNKMLDDAMYPALDRNQELITGRVQSMLVDLAGRWERV